MFKGTGVYIIENKTNGKSYIGSTKKSFKHRIGNHMLNLRKNRHHSIKLQRAFNKYGEESFSIRILEMCNPSEARILEQEWFDRMSPEYNMTLVVNETIGMLGQRHSEKTKNKMSKSATGRVCTKEHRDNISKTMKEQWNLGTRVQSKITNNTKVNMARSKFNGLVEVVNKKGILLFTCWSAKDAADILNMKKNTIAAVLCGQRNSAYGYIFNKKPLVTDSPRLKSKEDLKEGS